MILLFCHLDIAALLLHRAFCYQDVAGLLQHRATQNILRINIKLKTESKLVNT